MKQLIIIGCSGTPAKELTGSFVQKLLEAGFEVTHAGIRLDDGTTDCLIGTAADAAEVDGKGLPVPKTASLSTLQDSLNTVDSKLDNLRGLFREVLTGLSEDPKPAKAPKTPKAPKGAEKKEGGAVGQTVPVADAPAGDPVVFSPPAEEPSVAGDTTETEQPAAEAGSDAGTH